MLEEGMSEVRILSPRPVANARWANHLEAPAWYKGYIVIRTDEEPAQLDFVIESYEEVRTSAGIFYWDGETLVVRAPVPGEPRPLEFKGDDKDDKNKTVFMRLKRGRPQFPADHCSTGKWFKSTRR